MSYYRSCTLMKSEILCEARSEIKTLLISRLYCTFIILLFAHARSTGSV